MAVARRPRSADRARYFGPYLGGQKARDAVSGLGRVLPLGPAAYWATDRPAGTGRELARARGAAASVPADLARAVAAVLDRDPGAVAALRAELIRRRDTAAAGLAFEFAGRVQAELEAVDWITAEQKVTQAQPSDFDVLGWAGGMLVRFEVRAGRLSGWTQRACPAPAARRHLASAPADPSPAWTDFARQTAELAALLRRCPSRPGPGPAGPTPRRASSAAGPCAAASRPSPRGYPDHRPAHIIAGND